MLRNVEQESVLTTGGSTQPPPGDSTPALRHVRPESASRREPARRQVLARRFMPPRTSKPGDRMGFPWPRRHEPARPAGWSSARVLVTSATGFIGAHLTKRLVSLGAQVHAVSRRPPDDGRLWHTADLGDADWVYVDDVVNRVSGRSQTARWTPPSCPTPSRPWSCSAGAPTPASRRACGRRSRGTVQPCELECRHFVVNP